MATHETFNLRPFWDEEFKELNYIKERFNDSVTLQKWQKDGFQGPFGGWMCDMRNTQPKWNQRFIDYFTALGWKNIGTSYYRMDTGSILPTHIDTYQRYIELYNLRGEENKIRRAVVFLEDWHNGHYAECQEKAYTHWSAGFTITWPWDAPHLAANLGTTSRYTLQITGHV